MISLSLSFSFSSRNYQLKKWKSIFLIHFARQARSLLSSWFLGLSWPWWQLPTFLSYIFLFLCVCVYMYMYIYMYMCMCVCVFKYIHIFATQVNLTASFHLTSLVRSINSHVLCISSTLWGPDRTRGLQSLVNEGNVLVINLRPTYCILCTIHIIQIYIHIYTQRKEIYIYIMYISHIFKLFNVLQFFL